MIEDALKALSAADAPPARDQAFEIAVMARIERHRFRRALARNAALVLAASLVLALVMPVLAPLWQDWFTAGRTMLPPGVPPNLALGFVLTAASLAMLPWLRRLA